jgi:hypothetical protein
MGRGAKVDVLAISQEMRKAVRLWETVYVIVLDPGANKAKYLNKDNSAFVWHGFARYQPYRKDIPIAQVTNPTTTATSRFQIDFDADGPIPEIRTNWEVWIVPAPLASSAIGETVSAYPDAEISRYEWVVTSAANSSLAWQRTVECITDTKTRFSPQVEPNGSGGFRWVP